MSNDTDRHLLFGLLALQSGLVNQDQLIAALLAWKDDKARPIDDHLAALGCLDEVQRATMTALVDTNLTAPLSPAAPEPADPNAIGSLTNVRFDPASADHAGSATGETRRFRLLKRHDQGGLGIVYVALDTELNREVALKQIQEKHADDPTSRSRFLIEAEITGGLEHPGIVPVYGLGTHDDGRPYYAMRFIRGGTLQSAINAFHKTKRSDRERPLKFRQLLRNFVDVCNAIEYAHSRGVLHRDIKPANVIVGKHGETLVVDWGLAKALGKSSPDSAERALVPASGDDPSATQPGQALGTPAYMGPEQALGNLEAVGPRSDVYSLGATLYCLLVGKAPFRGAPAVIRKAAELGNFQRPRAIDGSIDPALEAIALKAMAKAPDDRYESARALADDVDRWLANERVQAYREPWTRSLGRWLARHRTGVTGIAAAGIVALIGLAAVSVVQTKANNQLKASNAALDRQRKRAEANETQAIDAVKRFKDAIANNPELKNNPELESLRKTLLKEPLAFFGQLRERLQADDDARPEALARLANAAFMHGMLIDEIGNMPDAIQALEQAVAIGERLNQDHPNVAEYQANLADSLGDLGTVLQTAGQTDRAQSAYERAIAIRERLTRDHPDDVEHREDLAASLCNLGVLLANLGRIDEGRKTHERAIDIRERLVRDHPANVAYQAALATSYNNLGVLLYARASSAEVQAAHMRALAIRERLARDHPAVADYQADLADSHLNLGTLLRDEGRANEARAEYEQAVAIRERLVRDHPAITRYQASLAQLLNNLGKLLRSINQTDQARTAHERAVAIAERLALDHPAVAAYQASLANSHFALGELLHLIGRTDAAMTAYNQAVEVQERLVRDHPAVPLYQFNLATTHNNLGVLFHTSGRLDEARSAHERAVAIRERLVRDLPADATYQEGLAQSLNNLGVLLADTGHPDEALAAYEQDVAIKKRLIQSRPRVIGFASNLGSTLHNMARIDLAESRFAEARGRLLEAISWQKKALDVNPENPRFRHAYESHLIELVRALRGLGHDAEAAQFTDRLTEFRLHDPRLQALDARLAAVRNGEQPSGNPERLALAQRAYDTMFHATAARLWADALASDPKLAADRQTQHPYNAACAAALAAAGQGKDEPAPDDAEKAKLRRQALDWLHGELAIWETILANGPAQAREVVAKTLQHWQEDADLAGVRDPDSLAELPEEERQAWRTLWDAVKALLQRASTP